MNSNNIIIDCLEVKQPIGTFYVGKMKWPDLLSIARNDIERIRQEGKGSIDGYYGIQRELSPKRLKEISQYVTFEDATFPNSIVISIDSISIEEDSQLDEGFSSVENILSYGDNKLSLRGDSKIAKIIDGQHRLFGLERQLKEDPTFKEEEFELIVTIFIDIDEEYQSNIFATINKAQTKVNKSIVYDLYSLAKTRSPQRTVHNVIKLLNEKEESPFYHLIKRLGKADFKTETIAQATFADSIIRYISKNPALDRNILMKGKSLDLVQGNEAERLFLRNWFINPEDEVKIAKLIWNYFEAVQDQWGTAWGNTNYILTKSTGIIAFMRFLKDIVAHEGYNKVLSVGEFQKILQRSTLNDDNFKNQQFAAGGVGQSYLYQQLKSVYENG